MLIVMDRDCSAADLERVRAVIAGLGYQPRELRFDSRAVLVFDDVTHDPALFSALPGVRQVLPGTRPLRRATRVERSEPTRVRVGGLEIGGGSLTLIAGPCAVETPERLLAVATRLREAGADLLRGGAYKPRTSPYDFQGLGEEGLRHLAQVSAETGMPVISEALDPQSMDRVERHVDVVQIGARNMQNFPLLRRAGLSPRPILLKRGMSASVEDWLAAAEYILDAGNEQVILCERGIRTFSDHSRYTLDLSVVPRLRQLSHLPICVDPSHASGLRDSVPPLARAAAAVGADAVMVEVHPDPVKALCDGAQSLRPEEFAALATDLRAVARLIPRLDVAAQPITGGES